MVAFYMGHIVDNHLASATPEQIIRLSGKRAVVLLENLGFPGQDKAGMLTVGEVRTATVRWLRNNLKNKKTDSPNPDCRLIHKLSIAASNRTGTHIYWG